MQFQIVIYKKWELEVLKGMPKGWKRLSEELKAHKILIYGAKSGTLQEILNENNFSPESVLVISAKDETLEEAIRQNIAVLAYKNPMFPDEELYQADFLAESFIGVDYYFLERVYQRKHGIPWRVIDTRRCYLREMTVGDLPDLYVLYSDLSMTKYLQPLSSMEEETVYVKTHLEQMYHFYGYGFWIVKDRFTDELIGRAGFEHYCLGDTWALEMGYAVAKGRRRQGYAFEICQAMLDYIKGIESGFDKVYCFVQEDNTASKELLKKLGFCYEGMQVRGGKNMLRYVLANYINESKRWLEWAVRVWLSIQMNSWNRW